MGCDIHFYTEKRDADGVWRTADTWVEDQYDPGRMEVPYERQLYTGRNYGLFAILANVRNGYGFAGVKTGDGYVPISEPRGTPINACDEYMRLMLEYGADGHSHSHHTVRELLEYDWTQTTKLTGLVGLREWARWKNEGAPESWCGDVSGGGIVHVSSEDMDVYSEGLSRADLWSMVRGEAPPASLVEKLPVARSLYVHIEWQRSYYEVASEFLSETMPRLWRLGSPDDVRILFFFDN